MIKVVDIVDLIRQWEHDSWNHVQKKKLNNINNNWITWKKKLKPHQWKKRDVLFFHSFLD